MALQRPLITDFTAGELSPKFSGRSELALYAKGGATLQNWVPFAQGGIITRPGGVYKGTTKSGATAFDVKYDRTPTSRRSMSSSRLIKYSVIHVVLRLPTVL